MCDILGWGISFSKYATVMPQNMPTIQMHITWTKERTRIWVSAKEKAGGDARVLLYILHVWFSALNELVALENCRHSTHNPSDESEGLTITLFLAALWVSSSFKCAKCEHLWYAVQFAGMSIFKKKHESYHLMFAGGSTQYNRCTRSSPTLVSPNKGMFDLLSATQSVPVVTRMIGPAECRLATKALLFL